MPAPPKFPSAKNIGVTRVLKAGGKHVYRDEDERTDGQVAEIIIIGISVSVRPLLALALRPRLLLCTFSVLVAVVFPLVFWLIWFYRHCVL